MSGRWDLLLEEDSTGEHPRITKGAIWWDGLVPVIVQDGTHSHSLGQAVVRRVPAARGGHNDASNGAPLCRACNRGKSDRLEVWAVARWVTPWVGWSFPVPTPVMLAAAIVVAAVLTRGAIR